MHSLRNKPLKVRVRRCNGARTQHHGGTQFVRSLVSMRGQAVKNTYHVGVTEVETGHLQ
jgi:hypothetical protein